MSKDCYSVVVRSNGVDSLDFYDNLLIDFENLFFFYS